MRLLINHLIDKGYLETPAIINAFKKVNRTDFLLPGDKTRQELEMSSEINAPLPLFSGQTISQPLTVAYMLELLQPKKGDSVLDIGSGSGWTACLLAELVGPKGKVIAIERIEKLKEFGQKNAAKYKYSNLEFINGDGTKGYSKKAPYNVIHVAAAAETTPPELVKQLADNGRLVIPVGKGLQDVLLITKSDSGKIKEERHPGFSFVPLIGG